MLAQLEEKKTMIATTERLVKQNNELREAAERLMIF
jgi:hypothetical protein